MQERVLEQQSRQKNQTPNTQRQVLYDQKKRTENKTLMNDTQDELWNTGQNCDTESNYDQNGFIQPKEQTQKPLQTQHRLFSPMGESENLEFISKKNTQVRDFLATQSQQKSVQRASPLQNNNDSSNQRLCDDSHQHLDISQLIIKKHKERKKNQITPAITNNTLENDQKGDQQLLQVQTENFEQGIELTGEALKEQSPKFLTFRMTTSIKKNNPIKRADQTLKDMPTIKTYGTDGIYCRICCELETKTMPLIQPCKCIRKRQYAHEECLKTEILAQNTRRIREAKCSVCDSQYKMFLKGKREFLPQLGWQRSQDKLPLICLCVFQIVLFVLVILMIVRLTQIKTNSSRQDFLNNYIFLTIFICFCVVIMCLLSWFIFMIVNGIVYVERISEWRIKDHIMTKRMPTIFQNNLEIDKNGQIKIQRNQTMVKEASPSSKFFNQKKKMRQSVF